MKLKQLKQPKTENSSYTQKYKYNWNALAVILSKTRFRVEATAPLGFKLHDWKQKHMEG